MILKILAYSLIFYFVVFRLGGFLFRTFFWVAGARTAQRQFTQGYNRRSSSQKPRRSDGSVTVDYIPEDRRKPKDYKDGDYVDYEEVK